LVLLRSLEVAAHETDQPVQLIGDFGEPHVDVIHALFMEAHARLHMDHILCLELLHLSLTPLNLRHHYRGVLKLSNFVFEVHLNLV